jgi:hypothetical protein
VDDVDIGAVNGTDLVTPFGVGVAGDLHHVGLIRRVYIQGQRDIGGRPGDKVPEVEAELGWIRVNCGPVDGDGGPSGVGRVGSGLGDANGGSQGSQQDAKGSERAHYICFFLVSDSYQVVRTSV